MRSTTAHRRRRATAPDRADLLRIVELAHEAAADTPGAAAIRAIRGDDGIELGVLPLEPDVHPFPALAGLVAPEAWWAFGVRAHGTLHHLDDAGAGARTVCTFLVARSGADASIVRIGDEVHRPFSPAVGTIPDLCRRVLGLPTDPAPPSTALLWVIAWLDRLLEAWGDPTRRRDISSSFLAVAALHPAPGSAVLDPAALVEVGRAHTDAWPWSRLRLEPGALRLPEGELPRAVAAWMDDGFFARWAISAYPPASALVRDLAPLLEPPVAAQLLEALEGLLDK